MYVIGVLFTINFPGPQCLRYSSFPHLKSAAYVGKGEGTSSKQFSKMALKFEGVVPLLFFTNAGRFELESNKAFN